MSQQAPMLPTNTILELSQKNANLVNRNGDYSVVFSEPQSIKAGDQLSIKMIAIDSQDADSESIVLPLDDIPVPAQQGKGFTSLSIGYSFYEMNYDLESADYPTDAQIKRQKFVTTVQGAANPYPLDYKPYQPYGAIDERTLDSITMVFARKYANGKSGFNDRLDNYQVKVGFSWYSLEDDGTHLFNKSNFATDDYVYMFFDDFTIKNGKPVTIKNRPSSIATKTPALCTPTNTPLKFIKGTLQIAQISFVVRNAVPNLNTPIPTALEFLKFDSQSDSSSLFSAGVTKIQTTQDSLQVAITFNVNHNLSQGDHISISGMTDASAPANTLAAQYNGTHRVEGGATAQVINIVLTGTVPNTTVGVDQDPTKVIMQTLGRIQLVTGTTTVQIPNGRYDRESIVASLTKAFEIVNIGGQGDQFAGSPEFKPSTNLQFRPEDSPYGGIRFRKMDQIRPNDGGNDGQITFTSANSYNYKFALFNDSNKNANPLVGARKFAFDYGEDGDVFRWTNGHQSVCDPNSAKKNPPVPSETIGFFRNSDNLFYQINAATGLIINDMEPKSFWQDILGLYNNVVEPLQFGTDADGKTTAFVPYDCLRFKVPTESSPLNGFTATNTRTQFPEVAESATPTVAKPLFIDTASIPTNAVDGETPLVIGAGFYLVEILSLNLSQSNFIDNNENRGNISAIVSTQYNANDSITGFADSGIPYVHRGAPSLIASANVRILDPDTKKVPLNLGNRNTVFLQLSSEAPVYMPAQVVPTEDKPSQNQMRGTVE